MVFIKNSNKVQAFLKACAQNTTISVDLNAKYYPLSSIESILSQWNEKNPQNLYFLNEMIEFEDILFTLEHKAIEREQEFNVKLCYIETKINRPLNGSKKKKE